MAPSKSTDTTERQIPLYGLLLAGAGLLLATGALARLSHRFVWGEGHAERPVVLVVILLLASWGCYAFAAWAIPRIRHPRAMGLVLAVGIMLRFLMLPTNPILESDFYRYLWDGQVVAAGLNPYALAPAEMSPEDIVQGPDLAAARQVHTRISYPEVPSIYPPGAQGTFWLCAQLFGWNVYGFRILFLLADMALLFVLWRTLVCLQRPPLYLLLYAWCPLVLKEYCNSMHLDIVCGLLLGTFALAVSRQRLGWALAAVLAAGSIKITPLILLPLLLGLVLHQQGRRQAILSTAIACVTVAAGVALMHLGSQNPLKGLHTFSQQWENNGSIYPLVKATAMFLGLRPQVAALATKALLGGGLLAAVAWAVRSMTTPHRLLQGSLWTLLALYVISPLGNPWYLGWLLPFMVIYKHWPTIILMAFSSLYYLVFYLSYHKAASATYTWLHFCEYGPVAILCAVYAWWQWRYSSVQSPD